MGIADERCALIAARQHGCLSLGQAIGCGLTREGVLRRTRSRRWQRILPRVYAVSGTPETWERRAFSAVLWGGGGAVVSGRSAGALWGFPGLERGRVEISLERGRRARAGIVVRRVLLDASDVTVLDGLPITTAARTLADIAGSVDARTFDASFHHCLHSRLTDLPTLRDISHRRCGPGFPGADRLRQAIDAYSENGRPAASPLEARCARLLAGSPLPPPERQHEVVAAGRRRRLDFAWPRARVALEVDGYRWHSSRRAWESDRARIRDLRREGWTVVQATHDDLEHHFGRLVDEVSRLIAP